MRLSNGSQLVKADRIRRSLQTAVHAICKSLASESVPEVEFCPRPFIADSGWVFLAGDEYGIGWKIGTSETPYSSDGSSATWSARIAHGLRSFAQSRGLTLSNCVNSTREWRMTTVTLRERSEYLPTLSVASLGILTPSIHAAPLFPHTHDCSLILPISHPVISKNNLRRVCQYGVIRIRGTGNTAVRITGLESKLSIDYVGDEMDTATQNSSGPLSVELGDIALTAEEVAAFHKGAGLELAVTWPIAVRVKLDGQTVALGDLSLVGENLAVTLTDVFFKGNSFRKETFHDL